MALKRYTLIVAKNFTKGDNWGTFPYTRLSLIDRKAKPDRYYHSQQIDGMDFQTREGIKKHIKLLLVRNKLSLSKVNVVA